MIELKHRLTSFSPTGKVIDNMLSPIRPPGPPVFNIPFPEELSYPDRKDTDESLTPSQINESIFNEGLRLAGTDILDIGNGKEILVFNTSVASTHTLLTVTYDEWEESLRRQAEEVGISVPEGILIEGRTSNDIKSSPPTHVPLDMVTWALVRDKETQTYWPCDINDLTSERTGNEEIDKFKLGLTDKQLKKLDLAIVKRNRLAANTLLDLHNNILCQAMPFLREKNEEDLLIGGLSGYYRGDEAKNLDQFDYDHRGKGPMSNPTLHFRITDHFTMKDANILDQENPHLAFLDSIKLLGQKYPDYFKGGIDMLAIKPESLAERTWPEILGDFIKDPRFTPYDLIKSVDPFGSLAHNYLGKWLENELDRIFQYIPHATALFADHTEDYERELRVSEGATIRFTSRLKDVKVQNSLTAIGLAEISKWIGRRLYPMWDEVNYYVQNKIVLSKAEKKSYLLDLQRKYALPDEFMQSITRIRPTQKQLEIVRDSIPQDDQRRIKIVKRLDAYSRQRQHVIEAISFLTEKLEQNEGTFDDLIDLLTWIQAGQIFDYSDTGEKINQGYNIPGTPGTAITYQYDNTGRLIFNVGWVLSTKGLSELWLGTILKRKERRDR